MKTCVVTCTGGRPELFALCRKWVERCKPDVWLVGYDDGVPPDVPDGTLLAPYSNNHYARTETTRAHRGLSHVLMNVPRDHHVFIMEDDDYYPEHYIWPLYDLLQSGCPLAGPALEVRYHLPQQRFMTLTHGNRQPPAAGATAVHADFLGRYSVALLGPHGADHRAWRLIEGGRLTVDTKRISIKGVGYGLPGRAGATSKHEPTGKIDTWFGDTNYEMFRNLLNGDADDYISLISRD